MYVLSASLFVSSHGEMITLIHYLHYVGDDVYLETEQLRQEYVLSDTGLIYRGSASNGVNGITATYWQYGQVYILAHIARLLIID